MKSIAYILTALLIVLICLNCTEEAPPYVPEMHTGVIVAIEEAWFGSRTSVRSFDDGRIYRHIGLLGAVGDTVTADRKFIDPD